MIQIKEEFKKLIPALTEEEFKQLEDNCLRDGISDTYYIYGMGLLLMVIIGMK
jgi:hypothetical protein